MDVPTVAGRLLVERLSQFLFDKDRDCGPPLCRSEESESSVLEVPRAAIGVKRRGCAICCGVWLGAWTSGRHNYIWSSCERTSR